MSLPLETITDIMTLMYIGRDREVDMTLPSLERFIDYWSYLADIGCFSNDTHALVSQIMEKLPLAKYLQDGVDILKRPVELAYEK